MQNLDPVLEHLPIAASYLGAFDDILNAPTSPPHAPTLPPQRLLIKIPPPDMGLRRSSRHRTASESNPSGSEYNNSDESVDVHEGEPELPAEAPKVEYTTTSRGRRIAAKSYIESSEDDPIGLPADELFKEDEVKREPQFDGDDDDEHLPRYPLRRATRSKSKMNGFIVSDDEGKVSVGSRYPTRSRSKKLAPPAPRPSAAAQRASRLSRRNARAAQDEGDMYVDHPSSGGSADADGSFDEAVRTSSEPEGEADADADLDMDGDDAEGEVEQEPEADGRPYALRRRVKINYAIPPPLEELPKPQKPARGGGRNGWGAGGGGGSRANGKGKGLGWSANGAELGKWMGMGGDDSDSDYGTRTPRKTFGAAAGGAYGGTVAAGGMLPGDLAAAGTPSNLGKIGDSALADADPLGVNINVTFDEVGGLDEHIHSLKEMTLLPLLYPEVFQQFNVTPPRGVLFHGPPGTGKTLLARALAASCRTDGKQISFFMRKGADCLSKWVGEAERQLRLLFEEARNCQPSIIFFDEIDGLAPVRSSKQDQIHASIVSTLLALMDGMDGRGQVIVIGATNRPDAIDPALRRPGRFDREFYFPLPGLAARERILSIMTRSWAGWAGEKGAENVRGLAQLTKGYGGADLRALCTEAALNAVQRRYPQIYKTTERLLLKPESIGVGLRDFMISIKKLVPSSARSSSSAAAPLPPQLVPLLSETLEQVKKVIDRVLPVEKKLTALEEAEFEDEGGDEGALEREMTIQAMETLRIYRPRVILHGRVGMGQGFIAAAALHHLEGYHVQSLELGMLMSDSTRTVEAAIVQLFVEAKRHQPSVIYIPALLGWCAAVTETARVTVRAMLETLAPTDPILLLAIVDGEFADLPHDVRAWFGPTRDNRVQLRPPVALQRAAFFAGLVTDVQRPPNQFAGGVKRRRRMHEVLPIAPPLEPRQPTAAELAVQEENDQRVITLLKYRLGPILTELKRKFKRFTKRATEEYNFNIEVAPPAVAETVTTTVELLPQLNGVIEVVQEDTTTEAAINGEVPPGHQQQAQLQEHQQQQLRVMPTLFDMDLERMHTELYKGKYLTPQDFLDDIGKMVHNANVRQHEDLERLYRAQAMFTAAQVSIHDFDPQLRMECERMAVRERRRRDEHRKQRAQGKAAEDIAASEVTGPRRSGRTNGQQLELTITDPLKIERRFKRQRIDDTAASVTGSEEENGENRGAKRAKTSGATDDERDPLDIIGTPHRHVRPVGVRFVADIDHPENEKETLQANGHISGSLDMVVDTTPRKSAGFDAHLLNPASPSENPFLAAPPHVNGNHNSPPALLSDATPPEPPLSGFIAPIVLPASAVLPPHTPTRSPIPPPLDKDPSPIPMMIERSPTPPHPDFHVSEGLISQLQDDLREKTTSLTVEQLEQLRAICLGCIWRRRAEWERDGIVRELIDTVGEFVTEVNADNMDSSPSPP